MRDIKRGTEVEKHKEKESERVERENESMKERMGER